MIITAAPAAIMVIGVLIYALTEGKLSEIGKIMFACGLFVTLFHGAPLFFK